MRVALALMLGALPVAAQETPINSVGCEAAVEKVRAGEVEVGRLWKLHAEARARALEAWPGLEVRGRTGYPDVIESVRVGLRANLPIPGHRDAEGLGWRGRGAEAEAEAALDALDVALAVREAHLAVRVARAELAWLEEDFGFSTTRVEGLRKQVQAGVETSVTLTKEALAADELADEVAEARAVLALAEADFARFTEGGKASDEACAPDLGEAEHPALALARAGVQRAEGEGQARRREGWLWPTFLEAEWDQVEVNTGRILVSLGFQLPTFADETTEADAGDTAAQAGLEAANRTTQAEIQRLRAHLAASDARLTELDRPPPAELALLAEVQRLRPHAPDTIALQAAAARRERRRTEARFAREEVLIQLAHALGR